MKENMIIGGKEFCLKNHTYVMGILNVTPDSFSDGGRYNDIDRALCQVEKMIEDGASIIDIGGESTRPNHIKISDIEEIERVTPYIRAIKSRFDVPISLDSYKSSVVKAGIDEGIDLINDIWGLKYDESMADIIAKSSLPCCLMHNRDNSDGYNDFVEDVLNDLRQTLKIADRAGIDRDKIILDPGVGFGKTFEQNLIITNNMHRLLELDLPVLLGTSRKSMIGNALSLPVDERVEGTIATSVMAVMKGVSFVRVHDVKENKRTIDMTLSIINS